MNVDTFTNNPSIKWYFVTAVPFMLCIFALWYIMKYLAADRRTPYRRSIYETFFHDMATTNPALWSRTGPRAYIVPKGRFDKLKWLLIRLWSAPEKTIRSSTGDGSSIDNLSTMSKLKRYLIRRWTAQIETADYVSGGAAGDNLDLSTLSLEAADILDSTKHHPPEQQAIAALGLA